jgi:hypothetical protein
MTWGVRFSIDEDAAGEIEQPKGRRSGTIALVCDIWPGLPQRATVGAFRIDTPDLRASQQCAKGLATQLTKDFLADSQIWIKPNAFGSFGRALADVQAGGKDLGKALMDAGLARPYVAGRDGGWCEES